MILFWLIVFIISLIILIKGADWLLVSAEKIGFAAGLSPFIIGVTIIGLGTSFPELITSLFATFRGATEIVTANAIGSNIANILLVIGFSALIGKRLVVTKNLIDLDLPLLAISTVLLLGIIWDRQVTFFEALLLLISYSIYLLYTVSHKDSEESKEAAKILPSREIRRKHIFEKRVLLKSKLTLKDFVLLIAGIIGLFLGAKYLIESIIKLAEILDISTGVIAITAVSVGTSLPELFVSMKAACQKKSEVAIGNIFGSNVFNSLVVIGLPGMFKTLSLDNSTYVIGVPIMALATLLFIISGISRKIHMWEGAFFLLLYIFFIGKLFNLF
ncbi:calcium/sodium antiporter [Patescibacteria group bacterium]|nr:calcium/sodium antiporter [Patescibacteria group bacterium]